MQLQKNKKGIFLIVEGTDGSGKSEQSARLFGHLKRAGYDAASVDFPRYSEQSSYFVREYLNGNFGGLNEVSPEKASLFFALDRFAAEKGIREALQARRIVVANRYIASNMAHQGAKISDAEKRKDFFKWLHATEYGILGISKPDLSLILHVPAEIAYELVAKKGDREYLKGGKRDIHEADIDYMKRTESVYLEIAGLFPDEFTVIECAERGAMLSRDEIESRIWKAVQSRFG